MTAQGSSQHNGPGANNVVWGRWEPFITMRRPFMGLVSHSDAMLILTYPDAARK
jgi:hypothetical protein